MGKILLVLLSLAAIFLTSCSSHLARKDGPPNYYVDVSKIPNATPKPEPLSKYGNMASYRVFGKRYYPLKSSKHYEEVGVASWYGTQFHQHRTSSGERYNMLAMTAAHKTLPLPTYLEVTNLRNDQKIIVKVNDRGPFASNRIIDLSYVAAKKLGMLGHGTAPVHIRAIDPYEHNQPHRYNNFNNRPEYNSTFMLAKNTPRTLPISRSFSKRSSRTLSANSSRSSFKQTKRQPRSHLTTRSKPRKIITANRRSNAIS